MKQCFTISLMMLMVVGCAGHRENTVVKDREIGVSISRFNGFAELRITDTTNVQNGMVQSYSKVNAPLVKAIYGEIFESRIGREVNGRYTGIIIKGVISVDGVSDSITYKVVE